VNFSLPLRAFEPSLRGLRNLLQLSHLSSRAVNFVFCSSTAAILGPNHPSVIPEVVSTSPDDADTLGYSKSKWVAEAICSRVVQSLDRKLKVKIMRIGQLTGDTQHGMWNMSEAYPLMLSTVREVGCLPKIQDKLSWLPLDVAARIICENALAEGESCLGSARVKSCELYHVVNNDTSISFVDLLGWLRIRREPFEIVEPAIWLEKLEKLDSHPAKALIGLWKRAYADDAKEGTNQTTVFETKNTVKVSQTMRNVHPVDERLIKKIWEWLERELAESR
jgi:thioester reductase-like protein